MEELTKLLDENPRVQFLYEASVCGGIPIINIMKRSSHDRVTRVVGIMNGTTNYVLSEMDSKGVDYQSVSKKVLRLMTGLTYPINMSPPNRVVRLKTRQCRSWKFSHTVKLYGEDSGIGIASRFFVVSL